MRSTTQGAGNSVNDNLALYLDAANQISYPGSGNRWYDMSSQKNDFTLVASPTYTGKGFSFNGSTQYAQCINNTFGNFNSGSFTMEYVANATAATSQAAIIMKRNQSTNIGIASNPGLCDRIGANECFVQDDNPGAASGDRTHIVTLGSMTVGTTAHMVYTIERNGFDATGSRYLNGTLTTTNRKTFVGSNTIDNANTMLLMAGSGATVGGSLYLVRFYNKVLTSDEVLQNYEALRPRFFPVP